MCAGLVSNCGCDSLCTRLNVACRGCSGVSHNANVDSARMIAKKMCKESHDFDSFMKVCNVDRFLGKDLSGLNEGDDSAFASSRFDGKISQEHVLDAIEVAESKNAIEVTSQVKNLRAVLRLAMRAQNHITTLIFEDLRKINNHTGLQDFYTEEPNLVVSALKLRSALTDILTKIGGRAVHPITCKVGGFSVDVDETTLSTLKKNLESCEAFAVLLVDIFAKKWQKSDAKQNCEALTRVLNGWHDLSDPARFAAAKASLRPPESDKRKECIAEAIEIVDAIERIKTLL